MEEKYFCRRGLTWFLIRRSDLPVGALTQSLQDGLNEVKPIALVEAMRGIGALNPSYACGLGIVAAQFIIESYFDKRNFLL